MRTPQWIGVVVLALVTGGLLGYFAAPRDRVRDLTVDAMVNECGDPGTNTPELDTPGRSYRENTTESHAPRLAPSNEGMATAVREPDWLEGVDLPELQTGTGKVTIRVVDQHGTPVSGFAVGLRLPGEMEGLAYPQRKDFDSEDEYIVARIRYQYINLKFEQKRTLEHASGADGVVKFTNLPGETAGLAINTRDYLIEGRFSTMNRPVDVGAEFELMVLPAKQVNLLVESPVQPNGTSCRVEWTCGDYSGGRSGKVGEPITAVVPRGDVKFAVIRSRDASVESTTVNVGDSTETIRLTLGEDSTLHGLVIFLGPRPERFHVLMAKVVGSATDEELLRSSREFRSTRVDVDKDTDAYVIFEDLEGEHVIGVLGDSGILVSKRVTLGAGSVELDLEVPAPDVSSGIAVVVQRPESAKKSREQFRCRDALTGKGLNYDTWTLSETRYLLVPNVRMSTPLPVEIIVSLNNDTLGIVEKYIRTGIDREVKLTFVEPCEVTLTIKNLPRSLAWPTVVYSRGPDFDLWHSKHFGNPSGVNRTSRVGGFQPGTYRVRVSSEHHHGWVLGETEVVLESGKQKIELSLSELHSVMIDGSTCEPYTHARIKHVESGVEKHLTFSDGHTAMFSDLPAGTYELTYTANGIHGNKKTATFTLPGSDTVVLTGD